MLAASNHGGNEIEQHQLICGIAWRNGVE